MGSIRSKFYGASIVALAILILVGVASLFTIRNLVQSARSVSRTYEVLQALEALDSTAKDLQRGARGYALTGQQAIREPYKEALTNYEPNLERLRGFFHENTLQSVRMDELEKLFEKAFAEFGTMVRLRDTSVEEAERRALSGIGADLIREISGTLQAMRQTEYGMLRERERDKDAAVRLARYIIVSGSAIAVLVAILSSWVIQRDLARREQTEKRLRLSEEKFRAFVETTGEWIWSVDRQGRRTYSNPAAQSILGYTPDELAGHHIFELLHPEDQGKAESAFADCSKEKRGWSGMVLRFRNKEGSYRWLESNAVPVIGEDGNCHGFRGADRDVTERRKAEEVAEARTRELARSNAELEQFAYVASHDLQEPLRMVVNYCKLLQRRYAGKLDKDADEFIHFAVDGATRMQRLIEDLLAYSRVGTRGGEFVQVDTEEVVTQAKANLRMAISEKHAEITHENLPVIPGDPRQLVQLFQNLIGNALKFQEHGTMPRVHISAETREHEWVFSIRDNGIGMDPEFFDKIFVIFQRLHTKAEYSGTGIGLAICKKIVERHGGHIWVESREGQGTTFFFTIAKKGAKL